MSEVRFSGIEKSYGDSMALRGLEAVLPSGRISVLLGPSGCGKTTLLRILAGLAEPDAGRVVVGDTVLNDPTSRVPTEERRLGMVFQDALLWPHLTVRGNIAFPLGRAKNREEAVLRAARAARVDAFLDRYPGELSGGERQRAAIARAIVRDPDLLLLDEPLSGLDANLRVQVMETIRDVQRGLGVTTCYVTHDQEEALSLADHVLVMRAGRILQSGPPEEVYRRPRTAFVARFVGLSTLIPGRADKRGRVRTELGEFETSVGPDADAILALRPETCRLNGEDGVPGEVCRSRYLGGRWLVGVRVGEQEVLCLSDRERNVGDAVTVVVDPDPVTVVDDEEEA